jgi:hypothetical protein
MNVQDIMGLLEKLPRRDCHEGIIWQVGFALEREAILLEM